MTSSARRSPPGALQQAWGANAVMKMIPDAGHGAMEQGISRALVSATRTIPPTRTLRIMNLQLGDIAHIIQLAIAPVFMLSTVCTNLLVLLNRLARIIDRSRVLEERLDVAYNDTYMNELDVLYRRSHLINVAIALSTACGLFVCLVVALLFVGDATNVPLDKYIAGLFIAAMICLIGNFGYLLREIFIASTFMRAHRHVRHIERNSN